MIARNMKLDVDSAVKALDRDLLSQEKIMHPVVVSHITDETFKKLTLRSLQSIMQIANGDDAEMKAS